VDWTAFLYVLPRESVTVKTCPEPPARVTTAMKFPAVLFEANAKVEELEIPASLLTCWTSDIGGPEEVTVKPRPLLGAPETVTTTLPDVAPEGTGATMLVSLHEVGVAATPLKVMVLAPCVPPKFVPVMVIEVPITPEVGLRLVSVGGTVTVKFTPLLTIGVIVTVTGPLVAPAGTGAVICVSVQLLVLPPRPLKDTKLVRVPMVGPKFAPFMVTTVPTGPEVGLMLLITGGGVTVKGTPLLATPPTVTTTLPVVAPVGTGSTMLVALHVVGIPAVPLNVIVLVLCVEPKFVPVTVTVAPTGP
jgi:hypothetical protein